MKIELIFKNINSSILKTFICIFACSIIFLAFMTGSLQQEFFYNSLEGEMFKLEWRMRGPMKIDDPELVTYLQQKVLVPPSTLPYNLSSDPEYRIEGHSYGWKQIHETLKYLFSKTQNGFFVEAGALDGEFLSNSLWLEQTLNWTGLLVEPEDINFRDMVWKRRKAWLSHSCLSNEKYPMESVIVSAKKKKDGFMYPLTARGSSFLYSYSKAWKNNWGYSNFYASTDFTYLACQCFPLYTSLLALNITVIDFLSLDLQGAELDVLETIPLDKIFIRSFVIEKINNNESNMYDTIERFNKLGFSLFAVGSAGPDYFFINKNDSSLQEKAGNPSRLQFNVSHDNYLVDPFKI